MSRSQRRAMIDRAEPKLSLVRQCALVGISRSSLYYLPTEAGAEDLECRPSAIMGHVRGVENPRV